MIKSNTRREFLESLLAATGAALIGQPGVVAAPARRSTPLPNPSFYWGVGIENCWIPQTESARDGKRRLLDVFLQMDHYRNWKQDLDLLPATGVNCIRYSVPWYKAEPKPGVYDWCWIDAPVEYLVNKLKIVPLMDLIHYGTPAWMPDGVGDERFPEAIGKYAGAMARHFKGLVNHYSPHNEPELTCLFCGLIGRWPPYQTTPQGWAKIGVAVAKGMGLEVKAIRAEIPDAVVLSVDPWMLGVVDQHIGVPKEDPRWREIHLASSCYPASLAYGKITPEHPMATFLMRHGVKESELAWFQQRATKPDILGFNFYPDFRFGWSDRPDARQKDFTRNGTVPLEQAAQEAVDLITPEIKQAQAYFDLPVYLTETSAGLTVDARIAYINALGRWVRQMRNGKFPLQGVNWWPLFDTIQWDYREKADQPLTDFIYEGGWNNGLYRILPQTDGDLKRVPTPVVEAFHQMIQREKQFATRSANKVRTPRQ